MLPVFLFVVLGAAEISYYLSELYDVQRAARDGARVGAITIEGEDATGDEIIAAAEFMAKAQMLAAGKACVNDDGCAVSATWVKHSDGFRYVRVLVIAPHHPLTPGLDLIGSLVQAEFTMLTQQQI